jgi:hypothetical protein
MEVRIHDGVLWQAVLFVLGVAAIAVAFPKTHKNKARVLGAVAVLAVVWSIGYVVGASQ